ncbi:MAG TPA: hypothetical protein VGK33_15115 [Chloroflexota bacterium]
MWAPVDEPDRAFCQFVAGGARNQDFIRVRDAHDARGGVDIQSADFLAAGLTHPGVDSAADSESQRSQRMFDGGCATDGRARGVEQRKEAVTGRVDLGSSAAAQRTTDSRAVAGEQRVPSLVAQAHHVLRRANDVHEQEAERGARHGGSFVALTAHCA